MGSPSSAQGWKSRPEGSKTGWHRCATTLFSNPFFRLGNKPGVNTQYYRAPGYSYSRNNAGVGSPHIPRCKFTEQGTDGGLGLRRPGSRNRSSQLCQSWPSLEQVPSDGSQVCIHLSGEKHRLQSHLTGSGGHARQEARHFSGSSLMQSP